MSRHRFKTFVGIAMLTWLMGCSAGRPGLVDIATLERPPTPNSHLVCPPERTAAAVDAEPEIYALAEHELWRLWREALPAEPRVTVIASDEAARRLLLVQRTPVFRFPDVVQLEVYGVAPAASTLCLYSRSVYGYSDLGVNRSRVEGWLARIGAEAIRP